MPRNEEKKLRGVRKAGGKTDKNTADVRRNNKRKAAANVKSDAYVEKRQLSKNDNSGSDVVISSESDADPATDVSDGEGSADEPTPPLSSPSEAGGDSPKPKGRGAKAMPMGPNPQMRKTRNAGKTSVGMYDEDVPLSALAWESGMDTKRRGGQTAGQTAAKAPKRGKVQPAARKRAPAKPASSAEESSSSDSGADSARADSAGGDSDASDAESGSGAETSSGSGSESESTAYHDDKCFFCRGGGELMCCDSCLHVFHKKCLKDPKRPLPKIWHCPECVKGKWMDLSNVQRFLAARPGPLAPKNRNLNRPLQRQQQEYHVKWSGRSHIHCSWVSGEAAAHSAQEDRFVNQKLQAFERSQREVAGHAFQDKVDGVLPAWMSVDRILSERIDASEPLVTSAVEVLVKWMELPYDEATWERLPDIEKLPGAEAALKRLRSLRPIGDAATRKSKQPASKRVKHGSRHRQDSVDVNRITNGGSTTVASGEIVPASPEKAARRFVTSPEFLTGTNLYEYQLEGLNWLVHNWSQHRNGILADEMGLGKTIQSIAFIAALEALGSARPALVVVPLSTLPNWMAELATWVPHLYSVALYGTREARDVIKQYELYSDSPTKGHQHKRSREELQARVRFNVCVTTYETTQSEISELRKLEWETVVVDEAHRLRSTTSSLFQALASLRVTSRVALTGTPLQNNIGELFHLLSFLEPEKFGGGLMEIQEEFSHLEEAAQVAELHRRLQPHLLRRLKRDVLSALPPKKEQIVRVELAPKQREMYRAILLSKFEDLTAGRSQPLTSKRNLLMELRKCCGHPELCMEVGEVEPDDSDPAAFEEFVAASGKLALLDQMVRKLRATGHRVLIYSQFALVLNVLEDWLLGRGWPYFRLDGEVASEERQRRIMAFNRGGSHGAHNSAADAAVADVFLLSTRAGGLGINLATADTVVLFDSDWNPHNDLQAMARAHRLGQTRPVMIYRMVSRSTVEEKILDVAKGKMVLEHLVVATLGGDDASNTKGNTAKAQSAMDEVLMFGARNLFNDEAEAEDTKATEGGDSRKQRLPGQEAAAGRTGGAGGRRIVYDDAAIEGLLDRSNMVTGQDEGDAEAPESDFMRGFKVAAFDFKEDVPDETKEETGQPSQSAQAPNPAAFWSSLMKAEHEQQLADAEAALGKGKRNRRQVNYRKSDSEDEEVSAGGDDDEFNGNLSDDSDDSSDDPDAFPSDSGQRRQNTATMDSLQGRASTEDALALGKSSGTAAHLGQLCSSNALPWPTTHLNNALPAPTGAVNIVSAKDAHILRPAPNPIKLHQFLPANSPTAHSLPMANAPVEQQPHSSAGMTGTKTSNTQGDAADRATLQSAPAGARVSGGASNQSAGLADLSPVTVPAYVQLEPYDVADAGHPNNPKRCYRILRIANFDQPARSRFAKNLMMWGMDSFSPDRSLGHLLGPTDVANYGHVFMACLRHKPYQSTHFEGIPKVEILQGLSHSEVFTRLGVIELMRGKIEATAEDPSAFVIGQDYDTLRTCASWKSSHDRLLLKGILHHGYGRWAAVADDPALGLRAHVRAELAAKDAAESDRARALGKVSALEADKLHKQQLVEADRKVRDDVSASVGDRSLAAIKVRRAEERAAASAVSRERTWLDRRTRRLIEALERERTPSAAQAVPNTSIPASTQSTAQREAAPVGAARTTVQPQTASFTANVPPVRHHVSQPNCRPLPLTTSVGETRASLLTVQQEVQKLYEQQQKLKKHGVNLRETKSATNGEPDIPPAAAASAVAAVAAKPHRQHSGTLTATNPSSTLGEHEASIHAAAPQHTQQAVQSSAAPGVQMTQKASHRHKTKPVS